MLRYVIVFVLFCPPALCSADDEAVFVLKAVRAERSRLESGRCAYSGTKVLRDRNSPETGFDTLVSGEIVVDGDRYRIDSLGPEWVVDPQSAVSNGNEKGGKTAHTIRGVCIKSFATNGVDASFWLSFQPVLQVANARDAFVPTLIRSVCLDPRCPTVFGSSNWSEGITWAQAFSDFDAMRDSKPIPWKVKSKVGGLWTLAVSAKDEHDVQREWSLAVDTENGFVPTKYSVRSTTPKGGSFTEMEVETEWQEVGGVRVPVRMNRQALASPFSNRDDQLVLEFRWSEVNQPIAASAFSYETFPLTPGTGIQNVSTSEWLKEYPKVPLKSKPAPVSGGRIGVSGLVIINAVLLILFLVAGSLRRNWSTFPRSWKTSMAIAALVTAAIGGGFMLWPTNAPQVARQVHPRGLAIDSWSPVRPDIIAGANIDLGKVKLGNQAHREVFITNGEEEPLNLKEIVVDCPGVRLALPSMTIQPDERVGAMLDCKFDSALPPGDRVISVRALKEDKNEAFVLKATVQLLAR